MIKNQSGISTLATMLLIMVVLVIGGTGVYLVSQKSEEPNKSPSSNNEPAQESADHKIATDKGSGKVLPNDFPKEVPVFEPNKISTISTKKSAAGETYVVGFIATSSADEVRDFYQDRLSNNGWSIDRSKSSDRRFLASNGSMDIIVGINKAGNNAAFTITAPKQQ